MPSPLRALLPRSTPGHHRVGLEVSAAWQSSGWRVKRLFALLLAPQALSNSLGITVTWLWVRGTLALLIFSEGQGREWRGSSHKASRSIFLQIPSSKELQFFHLHGWRWTMGKRLGTSSALFQETAGRARGSCVSHLQCFGQHFETAGRLSSTPLVSYVIAFIDESHRFNP